MILIDGEPPETCYECAFNTGEYTPNEYEKRFCSIKGKSFCLKDYKKRPNWCPLKGLKHGKWIKDTSYKCSECGRYALEWGGEVIKSNFCPNCGADMRQESYEDD